MKNLFLLLTLVGGGAATAQAQSSIKAGTVALGGGLHFSQTNSETSTLSTPSNSGTRTEKNTNLGFHPSVGYFMADNLAIGLQFSYNSQKWEYAYVGTAGISTNHNQFLRVGPFATYYRMFTEKFGLSGTLAAGYSRHSGETLNPNQGGGSNKGTGYYVGLEPSIVFFPVPRFGLNASLGSLEYTRGNSRTQDYIGTGTSRGKGSRLGADFGFNYLRLGGSFFLGR